MSPNFLLESQQKAEKIAQLSHWIQNHLDARELKRALAVKLALEGKPYGEITRLLEVYPSFITYWKQRFQEQGVAGLQLGYRGTQGLLTVAERQAVLQWLQTRNHWNLEELVTHLDVHYSVIYQSKQSYYDLFAEAGISWKKSQKVNPKSDPELVKKKREEIQAFIQMNQAEIESGQLVLLFLDECHLCWGDVCGYVWGKTDSRIEIPIENQRKRQTYYGALNYQTKEFILRDYKTGDGENTVAFIKDLQNQYPGKRIALIWDGASYHQSQLVKDFLAVENNHRDAAEWALTCILFAPHAPEQNPVEDVWLQGKNCLRGLWHLLRSFSDIKYLFKLHLNHQKFDFSKIDLYTPCSNPI